MKINYLILAHTNYHHLDRLIDALDDDGVSFFIHIDKTADKDYHSDKDNVFFVEDRENIIWGGFAMVEASIKLLRLAERKSGEGYYCLLSGADYPIRTNRTIKNKLAEGSERINLEAAPLPHKKMDRFEYYHFDISWRKLMTLSEKIITGLGKTFKLKRHIPFQIYVGSQWFALSNECVKYILATIKENPNYINFFKYSKIPDEAFFHTIIGNSKFKDRTKPCLTYMDWSTDPAPALITEKHIQWLQNNSQIEGTYGKYNPMFARKFNDESSDEVKMIDQTLRSDD